MPKRRKKRVKLGPNSIVCYVFRKSKPIYALKIFRISNMVRNIEMVFVIVYISKTEIKKLVSFFT